MEGIKGGRKHLDRFMMCGHVHQRVLVVPLHVTLYPSEDSLRRTEKKDGRFSKNDHC
jgi:hypothetical protein